MAPDMILTFLGTTSGGGPTETRNCSSLVLDALGTGSLWMVDCAEGTVRQFAQQPYKDHRRLRISRLTKVFITHMHADHTMGLITVLRNVLGIPKTWPSHGHSSTEPLPSIEFRRISRPPRIEVYGPAGIRAFVRNIFNLTHSRSDAQYCVHELLFLDEVPSAKCEPPELMHGNEEAGKDFYPDHNGYWREIAEERMSSGGSRATVDAGPIVHRGYIFRERSRERFTVPPAEFVEGASENVEESPLLTPEPRTIVILGDTSDASALIPLLNKPRCRVSLLVHEATDACMSSQIDRYGKTGRNRTTESVKEKAVEKGHSTPAMAGVFARQIGAEQLVLNHIGSRFPAAPEHVRHGGDNFRASCIREIERQATEAWDPPNDASAIAAWDYCIVHVPPNNVIGRVQDEVGMEEAKDWGVISQTGSDEMELSGEAQKTGTSAGGSSPREHNIEHGQTQHGGPPRERGRGSYHGHRHVKEREGGPVRGPSSQRRGMHTGAPYRGSGGQEAGRRRGSGHRVGGGARGAYKRFDTED